MMMIMMVMIVGVSSFKSSSSNIISNNIGRRNMHLFDTSSISSSSISSAESSDSTSRRNQLKTKLYRLCAVCDRGFGALPSDRAEIMAVVQGSSIVIISSSSLSS